LSALFLHAVVHELLLDDGDFSKKILKMMKSFHNEERKEFSFSSYVYIVIPIVNEPFVHSLG
jgi:hypothetical protein